MVIMGKLIGALTTAQGVYYYKCGLFFDDAVVTAVQLGSSDEMMADQNYGTWEKVVRMANTSKMSMVDYSVKAIPKFDIAGSIKTTPYENIKKVTIQKALDTGNNPIDDQFKISFSTGLFSAEAYVIPAASVDEATQLLMKTPLSSKINK
jgi:hypothetical protein